MLRFALLILPLSLTGVLLSILQAVTTLLYYLLLNQPLISSLIVPRAWILQGLSHGSGTPRMLMSDSGSLIVLAK